MVYKFQKNCINHGNYGKNFYSGSIEMYVFLYHLVLFHTAKDILQSNSHEKKRLSSQPLLYGKFTRRSNVCLNLPIFYNITRQTEVELMENKLIMFSLAIPIK